ncbi:hypothetical protein H0A36_06660 [Endozoicomonas sp. SM1973]|uniref:Ferric siderophore reductase C-terminal domain-containing protein n=1 Tax=Spartinivicinus marinus TaxID=2994442 RepID=A0A853I4R0_9GAMM|nr:(2Fe-2S)-binding protein [Spartinivicinus marinus]MCX4028353.1 hypothetical protein [Spartinivicinus marinus]NYZ65688.1 hypothetical protein [Spartinivicinus marinus]
MLPTCFEQHFSAVDDVNSGLTSLALFNAEWYWKESDEPDHISLDLLFYDSKWLINAVNQFCEKELITNRRVAASLVQKRLMSCVVSPLVAVYLFSGVVPQLNVKQLFINQALSENIQWRGQPFCTTNESLVSWLDDLINQFFEVFRTLLRVNPKAFWGNAALAIASPWSRLASFGKGGEAVQPNIKHFLSTFSPPIKNALEWLLVEKTTGYVCVPRRNSCCLKYSLPNRTLCGTCNRRSKEEQITLIQSQ